MPVNAGAFRERGLPAAHNSSGECRTLGRLPGRVEHKAVAGCVLRTGESLSGRLPFALFQSARMVPRHTTRGTFSLAWTSVWEMGVICIIENSV